jgi:hypothetical protein
MGVPMAKFTHIRNRPLYDALIDTASKLMSEQYRNKLYTGDANQELADWQAFELACFKFCQAQDRS